MLNSDNIVSFRGPAGILTGRRLGGSRTFFALMLVALAGVVFTNFAGAQTTRTWSGPSNGDWFTAANWTPSGVPALNDTVNINSGTINLSAPVTLGGQFNWTGGTLFGNPLTIAASGVVNISGNNTVYLENALTNAGTVNWLGTAGIAVYNNGTSFLGSIANLAGGVWNIQSDQSMTTGYSGPYYFNNAGTIIKSTTTGITTIYVPFNNSGSVTNQSGTINFTGGGTIGGTLAASAGKTIGLAGGNFTNANATAGGAGIVQFSNGNLFLPADIVPNLLLSGGVVNLGPAFQGGAITNLALSGSTLAGANTVAGTMTWTAGVVAGPLTIKPSGVLDITGNSTVYIEGALTNSGTVNWTGTAGIAVYNNGAAFLGTIVNLAGGVWNIQSDQSMTTGYSGPYYFNNAGTIVKSTTTGTTTIYVPFNNSGVVTNLSGAINFNGGGTINGAFSAAAGKTINFANGSFTSGGTVVGGAGAVQFNGGSLSLPVDITPNLLLTGGSVNLGPAFQGGAITNLTISGSTLDGTNTVTGTMTWTAGAVVGALTVAADGVLDITGNSTVYVEGPLTNAGVVNWTGTAAISIYNNTANFLGSIQNLAGGVWNIQSDQAMNTGYNGPFYFNNAGSVIKSVTTGTTSFYVPFYNSGTVTNLSGTLNFDGGGTIGGTFAAATGKTINFANGNFTNAAGAVAYGPGTIQFDGGNLLLPADIVPGLLLTGGNLNLGPAFQGGAITNLTLAGSVLYGTNTVAGKMTWTDGVFGGPLNVASGGILNIGGNSTVYLEAPLTNSGTVNWTGTAGIAVYNNAASFLGSIQNLVGGVWNIQSDQSMSTGYNGPFYFNNAGSVIKSVTTGTTTFSVPFYNTGTVTNLSGTINFNGGGTIGGTFAASAGKSINFDGGNFTSAGAVVSGPGTVQVNGANLTLTSTYIPNLLLASGNVNLAPTFQGGTITNLTLNGAALTGTNTVTGIFNCGGGFNGSLTVAAGATVNWSGGVSAGPLNVASNAILNIDGNSTVYVEAPLTNAGTVNWLGTVGIAVYNNNANLTGLIQNLAGAVWNIESDQSMSIGYNGPYYFNNAGAIIKSVATGTTTISVPIFNPGVITNLSGTINFSGGGTIGGTLDAAAGKTINFSGGNFSATAATVSGAGTVQVNGGALTLLDDSIPNLILTAGNLSLGPNFQGGAITNLALAGMTLNGTNVVAGLFTCGGGFSGSLAVMSGATMNWTGGASAGPLTIASGGVLNISGNSTVYVEWPLTNAGTVNWLGTVGISVYNNSANFTGSVQNLAGGKWNIQSDQSMSVGYSGNYFFNNIGTVTKSVTTGTTTFSIPFYNLGLVTDLSGTISFNTGGTIGGAFTSASGKVIDFAAGNFTSSGATMTGPGTIQVTGGNLALASDVVPNLILAGGNLVLGTNFQGGVITNLTLVGTILTGTNTVTGAFNCGNGFTGSLLVAGGATMNWTGGASAGPLTIATNGVLNINGNSTVYVEAPLTNGGNVDWTGTVGIAVYNNSSSLLGSIQNLVGGVWNIQSDQSMGVGYNGPYFFNNAGTVIKSGTTGTTTISPPFSNSGTLDVESGTMNFNGNPAYAQTGATVDFGVGSPTSAGHITISGNVNLDGTLGVSLLNGYTPKTGDVIPLMTYGSEAGIFKNLNLPQLGATQVWRGVYNAGSFQLQVVTNANFANQITGSVSDTLGHAVTNINVFAFTTNSGSDFFVSSASDASGNYVLNVTNGNWTVGVQGLPARGYNPVANQSAGITNANVVVNFIAQPYAGATYTITTGVNPAGAGTTAGDGTFLPGASVTVSAAAITNTLPYIFTNWTENGVFESASSSYTFPATRDRQLVANFTLPIFTVSASNNPVGAGNITGAGSYFYAATSLLTASPVFGYTFTNWTENGVVVGTNPALSTVIYTNHVFVANYTAANLTHTVTTVTAPPGLATIAGAGTYTNGQTANFSAPQSITNSPVIYTFQKFTLSNTVVGTSASFGKTFSTLDPTNLQYVAVYTAKTILPLVTNVGVNLPNPVPATTNFVITLRFDRVMNASVLPLVVLTNSAAAVQPVVSASGHWTATYLANDTYITPPITFAQGMDGTNQLFVSAAQDTNGNVLPTTNAASFVVDATPPIPPVLTLTASNSSSATVSWSAYSAPPDLNGFRVYLATTNFSSVVGMSALTGLGSGARSFQFGGLALDKPYYLAIQAVDVAGNARGVIPLVVTLPSTVPPPVVVHQSPVGANSAMLSWNGYNTSGLLGFAGFQIYVAQTNFSSVAGLTPQTMVGPSVTSSQVDGLNRANTYYFAVVGVNGTNGFNPAVTTVSWTDPYAGNISANTTIGGSGPTVVPINQSISVVNNATLTIVPGTTLLFASGTSLTVPGGTLVANGTALAPIIFDSANDTPGNTPAPGDWGGVTLGGGAGNSSLKFVEILYGGGLTLDNCAPKVSAFTAQNNLPNGLTLQHAATLTTSDALVTGNGIGLEQFDTAALTIQNSEIENNGTNAVAAGTQPLTATGDWWGAPEETNITASVTGNVAYTPFLTYEPLLTPAIGASNGVTQVGAQSVILELACRTALGMRISEDYTFAGVFFSPFTNYTTFPLSAGGGLKHIFAQYRSATGQTNTPVEVDVTYVTAGPVISSFSLAEGQVLTRPVTITGAATAALGMRDLEFYVDGVLQGTNAGGTFSQYFDIRTLGNAIHQVELLARDTAGNIATIENNVVIAATPPPAPVITQPGVDFGTNNSLITISGTAEPGINIQVTDNGQILAVTNADAGGHFTIAGVTLIEGANSLVAVASDNIGITPSAARHVTVSTIPPAAVVMNTPVYFPATGLTVSWRFAATGKQATAFQLFWSASPFTSTNQATGHSILLNTMSDNVQALANGTYYFAVVGYDSVGNPSPISALVSTLYDATPPALAIAYNPAPPVGVGQLGIVLTSSKNLAATPSLTIQPFGASSPISLSLTNVALNTWQSALKLSSGLPAGTATVLAAAQDQEGNVFNGAPNGVPLVIDTTPPTGRIATVPAGPIQTTNNVNVTVNLSLSEQAGLGTMPSVTFVPPIGASVSINMGGIGSNWSGTLPLTSAMGSGYGHFTLNAQDSVGNVGSNILSGAQLELYNTALPSPPAAPANLVATSLPGGKVRLTWNVSTNAQIYRLYRDPGTNLVTPVTLDIDNITSNSIVDLPPADGFYHYGVTASRLGSESGASNVAVGSSVRIPPPAPINVAVTLPNSGVEITWQEPAGETPDHYNVYRNNTLIQTVYGVVPVVDYPPRGTNSYVVSSADRVGNENPSAPVAMQLLVGPINNLSVVVELGQAIVLNWLDSDPTAVGFNVYRNGIRQNAQTITAKTFTDGFALVDLTQYAVTAVNNLNQESPQRVVEVDPVGLGLLVNPAGGTNRAVLTGYFDHYQIGITNLATAAGLSLSELQVSRLVPGLNPFGVTQAVSGTIAAGTNWQRDYIVPESSIVAIQTVQVNAFQQTDSGGSSVIYQGTFVLTNVQYSGTEVAISANQLPLAGGLTPFQVKIYNPSFVDMEVVVSRADGAQSGDVYISVLNSFGQEVSRTPFLGAPPGTIFLADGRAYVAIAAGASLSFTVPGVLVPAALAGSTNTTFVAVVGSIYNQIGTTNETVTGPLSGSMASSSLAQTPYYGTAQTDKSAYVNSDSVIITGQSISQTTGLPAPNSALNIGFSTRGYKWYQPVITDTNGNYRYVYNPAPGFGGTLEIWAAHPLVVDQLNQAGITIYRMYDNPSSGTVHMSKNGTLDFQVRLINPGDVPLTAIATTFSAYQLSGTNQTPSSKLTGKNLTGAAITIAPNQSQYVNLELAAAIDAPDTLQLQFTFTSAEGAVSTFVGVANLAQAVPVLNVVKPAVGYLEVSVNRGDQLSGQVTFVNEGLDTLRGVTLSPPTNYNWMSVNVPVSGDGIIHLPDLAVGQSNTFSVVFNPPTNTPIAFYQDSLTINGTNLSSPFKVNVFALVTSSLTGGVQFSVDDILGENVTNAAIRLHNNIVQSDAGPDYTDTNGVVTITNLEEGTWNWQVTAPGCVASSGTITVIAGQTIAQHARLNRSLVTVDFTVVPVPFTDTYTIVVSQTYETFVPLPVLVLTPSYQEFHNVMPGFSATYNVSAENQGLVQLTDVNIAGAQNKNTVITPLITYLPVLLPMQSVEIPFTVTFAATNVPGRMGGDGGCDAPDDTVGDAFASDLSDAFSGMGVCPEDATAVQIGAAVNTALWETPSGADGGMSAEDVAYVQCVVSGATGGGGGDIGGGGGGDNGDDGDGGPDQGEEPWIGWPASGAGDGCFAADTRVLMADGSLARISEVKPGDLVRSGERPQNVATIEQVYSLDSASVHQLHLVGAGGHAPPDLLVTDEHLVWVDGRGWTPVARLHVGEWLLDSHSRRVRVAGDEVVGATMKVYTLKLGGDDAFYADDVLVHDLCGPAPHLTTTAVKTAEVIK